MALPAPGAAQGGEEAQAAIFARRARTLLATLEAGRERVQESRARSQKPDRWFKFREKGAGTFDVRKSDSLVDPIIATISLTISTEFSPFYHSESEASASDAVELTGEMYLEGVYVLSPDRTWTLKSGRYRTKDLVDWLRLDPKLLEMPQAQRSFPHRVFLELTRD